MRSAFQAERQKMLAKGPWEMWRFTKGWPWDIRLRWMKVAILRWLVDHTATRWFGSTS